MSQWNGSVHQIYNICNRDAFHKTQAKAVAKIEKKKIILLLNVLTNCNFAEEKISRITIGVGLFFSFNSRAWYFRVCTTDARIMLQFLGSVGLCYVIMSRYLVIHFKNKVYVIFRHCPFWHFITAVKIKWNQNTIPILIQSSWHYWSNHTSIQ